MARNHTNLRFLGVWLTLGLAFSSCSCGTSEIQQQRPEMKNDFAAGSGDADFLVDFGLVLPGESSSKRFRVENIGRTGLSVDFERPASPFAGDFPSSLSSVEVGSGVELRLSFSPVEESPTPFEQVIEIKTNEQAGKTYRLLLRGLAVRPQLNCDPAVLDFGIVLVGSTATLGMLCTNPLTVPLETSIRTFQGEHAIYFHATAEGASNDLLRIEAGETAGIDVEFRAQSLGKNSATLELRDQRQQPIGSLPILANVVSSNVIVEPGSCLDFSYVNIGSTSAKSLTLINVGSEAVEISRIEVPDEHADDYSIRTPLPLNLAANGGSASVEVGFHPQRGGATQLALQIWTSEEGSAIPACVKGFGGGPVLACSPIARDMGVVGVGYPASARFNCANVGEAPEGIPVDPLVVQNLRTDNVAFTPTIHNPDGSVGPRARGYREGEHFQLEVSYAPAAEGFDEGAVQVQTNVNQVDLRLSGEGREVEPCDFSLNPPSLRFGVLARGMSRTLDLEIRNNGLSACIVNDLRLSDDSSDTFSVEEVASEVIEGGGSMRIPVTFAPTVFAPDLRAKVLFEISHPTERHQEVVLRGTSANSCLLVEPLDLDFGAGMPGCQAIERELTISNICGTPLEVASIDLGESPDLEDFSIVRGPQTPLTLAPQAYSALTVAFDPLELGDQAGTLEVKLSSGPAIDQQLHVATLHGVGSERGRQTDDFTSVGRPMIDILWVIDNSGSMSSYQERLRENLPAFQSFATAQRADFQIGVTTTALIFGGNGCPGGANGEENGRLFPVDGSHPRILTPTTRDLETHWRHNMSVGTCFMPNEESALEAAFRALSPPLINEVKDSRYNSGFNDGNAGFLRPSASLSVIMVSDAMDFSPQTPQYYIDFFLKVKRGRKDMVRVHAITGNRASSSERCGQQGDRMIDVVEATGGTWLSLCTAANDREAWTEKLEEMSKGVFAFAKRHILRGLPGDVNGDGKVNEADIELRLDGKVEPTFRGSSRVWTYDPFANAIDFMPLYTPKTSTSITASYDLACR